MCVCLLLLGALHHMSKIQMVQILQWSVYRVTLRISTLRKSLSPLSIMYYLTLMPFFYPQGTHDWWFTQEGVGCSAAKGREIYYLQTTRHSGWAGQVQRSIINVHVLFITDRVLHTTLTLLFTTLIFHQSAVWWQFTIIFSQSWQDCFQKFLQDIEVVGNLQFYFHDYFQNLWNLLWKNNRVVMVYKCCICYI